MAILDSDDRGGVPESVAVTVRTNSPVGSGDELA